MSTDPRSGTLNLTEAQSSKATQVNENLAIISAITVGGVVSGSITSTPGSPVNGDTYLVPATGVSGAWAGHEKAIAHYQTSKGWRYYTPLTGYKVPVIDRDGRDAYFNGTIWVIQPQAEANLAASISLGATIFPFDTLASTEEGVSLSSDTFTAPVDGKYRFEGLLSLTVTASASPGTIQFLSRINGTNQTLIARATVESTTATLIAIPFGRTINLSAGDTIGVGVGTQTNISSSTAVGGGFSWMQLTYI